MSLWKAGKGWRYEFQYQGIRYNSTYFTLKSEAATAREAHKKQVLEEAKKQKSTVITFSDLANKYLDWSEKRHAKKTYEYKKMVCRNFISFAGDLQIDNPCSIIPHIEAYLNSRSSNHNFNVHRKELKAIFNFGINKGIIPSPNPVNGIDKLPEDQTVKYIPPQEDIVKVILAAGEDRPLLLILLHTMARISEILGLRWRDVNLNQKSVRLWTKKRKGGGLEYDDYPMNNELAGIFKDLWKKRTQEEWVFINDATGRRYTRRPKLMAGICKRAGVKPFGFHAIRHFGASYLADRDKISIKAISGLLRHKSMRTTELYLHSIDESQREAAEQLSFDTFLEKTPRSNPAQKIKGATE